MSCLVVLLLPCWTRKQSIVMKMNFPKSKTPLNMNLTLTSTFLPTIDRPELPITNLILWSGPGMTMQRKLVCPINFGMVEENLYRSGQPSEINFPFLSTLGLSAIIWLAVEEPQENFLAWADENDITIHHMGIQEGRDIWDPMLTEDCVVDALNVIVRVNEIGPLAIMCNLGRHRTGTVVGCLRRLQGWNLARFDQVDGVTNIIV